MIRGQHSPRNRLTQLYDILLLEPWAEMMGSPHAYQLVDACARLHPDLEAHHEAEHLRLTRAVLTDEPLARVFCLATEGLQTDLPALEVLRHRLSILISLFTS